MQLTDYKVKNYIDLLEGGIIYAFSLIIIVKCTLNYLLALKYVKHCELSCRTF